MLRRIAAAALACLFAAAAQTPPAAYPVTLDGQTIFQISTPWSGLSSQQRADEISRALVAIAQDNSLQPSDLRVVTGKIEDIVLAGRTFICSVSDDDASLAGRPRRELTAERVRALAGAIDRYRESRRFSILARSTALTVGIWLLFALFLGILRICYRAAFDAFTRQYDRWTALRKWFGIVIPLAFRTILFALSLLLALAALFTAISRSLALFSATAALSSSFVQIWSRTVGAGLRHVIDYLPSLLVVILVCAVAWYLIRLTHFFERRFAEEELSVEGFHADWARPTARIIDFLIIAATLVAIFPYLPGGDSPALRGVSILIGVLVSFGSGSAIGNLIAGIILTYMRSFRIGDRVELAGNLGDIIEQNLLVTRLRTIKNVEVIVPNSVILGAHTLNYSAEARARGLILHTSVTIGYDAPWRKVHELLIEAALATEGLLSEPLPFVFQTALNDFNVSYEINAYTDRPNEMARIYSSLHVNIQESFNKGGVEIMSPNYLAFRDGNASTIPKPSA
jgi:small-conductance mechanosensitive channel